MATFKYIIFEHHKKQDGSYNVKVRITHQRKVRYISTSTYVFKDDITKSLKIKDQSVIRSLEAQIRSYYEYVSELGSSIQYMDAGDIVEFINKKDKQRSESENPKVDLYHYLDSLIKKMEEANRYSSAGGYKAMKKSLSNFNASNVLFFSDITVTFLQEYEEHMRTKQKNIGERGIYLYLSLLRATFNFAMKEFNDFENDIIKIKGTPFSKFEMPENPTPAKRALPIEKIIELMTFPKPKSIRSQLAIDVFMLSFYLCGMNSVDLFSCDSYDNNRITYYRQKTRGRRKDRAKFSVMVPPEAKKLFQKYRDPSGVRVLVFHRMYATYKTYNNAVNIGLKNIGSSVNLTNLQLYSARHSFASIARNRCKLPMDYVSQAMNHSLPQFETTDFYIEEDWSIVDEVQKKVIAKLLETEKEAKNK